MSMKHCCPAPGCQRMIEAALFACVEHWRALPHSIRIEIYRTYRAGQDISTASPEYLTAAREAIAWYAGRANEAEVGRTAK